MSHLCFWEMCNCFLIWDDPLWTSSHLTLSVRRDGQSAGLLVQPLVLMLLMCVVHKSNIDKGCWFKSQQVSLNKMLNPKLRACDELATCPGCTLPSPRDSWYWLQQKPQRPHKRDKAVIDTGWTIVRSKQTSSHRAPKTINFTPSHWRYCTSILFMFFLPLLSFFSVTGRQMVSVFSLW